MVEEDIQILAEDEEIQVILEEEDSLPQGFVIDTKGVSSTDYLFCLGLLT